jgi:polyribonucleotide nucleotidyltransferase
MVKTFRLDEFGLEVEIGKFAQQADGAVWLKQGGTVLLSTVVAKPSQDFPGFLPLTIEYREQFSAAGKIPGGYFKREGRASEREVLIARLTDRSLRPLFPANFFDQTQIITTVYSFDKIHTPDKLALIASSLALTISKIPFGGPVGVVEMGRVDGAWVTNPTHEQTLKSDARLMVAGTDEGICMVEGSFNELQEKDFVDALFNAHTLIKKIVAWQLSIARELDVQTKAVDDSVYNWNAWLERAEAFLTEERVATTFVEDKTERAKRLDDLRTLFLEEYAQEIEATKIEARIVEHIFDDSFKEKINERIFKVGKRVDGRAFDEVRKISTEVGLLPFAHGSALFNRGQTQALVSVTLGGGQDEQRIETIMSGEDSFGSFMLHYNFPPFSVGEVKPMRGPGRREIGHGALAASAFKYVLPETEAFPYTIRIISDILSSNGSSSMATVCGSTMGLMQAGVPIKKMIGGIAMGLLRNKTGKFQVISDISGFEDEFGQMDFKVTGTEQGMTAIQLDIKSKQGFARDLFDTALEQARAGRLHILGEMKKVMDKPNATMSELVPKVTTIKINTDKIGAIIGSGGKTIKEIIEATGTKIDIEPDGLVKIFAGPTAKLDLAINWVKTLAGQIEPGARYEGKIRKIAEFGMFVELVPGLDGLLHISQIPKDKQRTMAQDYTVGDILPVVVGEYDDVTGRVSLRFAPTKK